MGSSVGIVEVFVQPIRGTASEGKLQKLARQASKLIAMESKQAQRDHAMSMKMKSRSRRTISTTQALRQRTRRADTRSTVRTTFLLRHHAPVVLPACNVCHEVCTRFKEDLIMKHITFSLDPAPLPT